MPARNKPYEQFGPYILFKRLEADSLGELWRAARIDGSQPGSVVALRRLIGGKRDALVAAAANAQAIAPLLTGTSFAKNQSIEIVDGVPAVVHDYAGGRSLRHIVDRARGGTGVSPNPIPLDQAIVIAEKIALSLATTSELKYDGKRLTHGALIPQFVWISDDGEIRVAGQQLGRGVVASVGDPRIAEIARFFPPEYLATGEPAKSTDVYSLGAILYLLVTGSEPPDAATASAFAQAVRAAKTLVGAPVPDDVRAILEKSLTLDPAARYESPAEMKQALSALVHGGKYSATTFNLAFYLSNLLKKEMEGEAIDREREMKVNVAAYAEAMRSGPAAEPTPAPAMFTQAQTPKSRLPMAIAAAVLVAASGIGAYFMVRSKSETPAPAASSKANHIASAVPAPAQPVSQPIVIGSTTAPQTAATGTIDPEEEQKRAFEEAVRRKLQEELMKLQTDYTRQLQQQQAKTAPVVSRPAAAETAAAPARQEETREISAAQFDQQRLATRQETPAPQQQAATQTVAPAVTQTQPPQQQAVPAPVPQAAIGVREGDVVDVTALDAVPRPLTPIRTTYPPLAARQRKQGTVLLTALISERGEVLEVKVLRGAGFGFDEAAVRAIRSTKFSAPTKDGKRVKTWYPQQVEFKM